MAEKNSAKLSLAIPLSTLAHLTHLHAKDTPFKTRPGLGGEGQRFLTLLFLHF